MPVTSGSGFPGRYLVDEGNHPSFGRTYGDDDAPPGLEVLAGYYDKGYAARYGFLFEAEKKHGKILISPLGNLSKEKPDGSIKHRIIQDLWRGEQTC